MVTARKSAAAERGVHLITRHSTTTTGGIVCPAVSPRLTEWIPELLSKLRSQSQRTVRRHVTTDKPFRASSAILSATLPEWDTTTDTWSDDTAEAVAYTHALSTLALTYDGENPEALSAYHRQRYADLTDTVESVGTGRGPVNGDLGALAKGPVALHRELDDHRQTITLLLDGESWTDLTDRRTGVRALAAIAVLADGFDVRVVVSPALRRALARRYPQWSEIHLGLTDSRDRSPHQGHRSSNELLGPTNTIQSAWDALDGLASTPGKRRLLGALRVDTGRTYADLADDPDLGIERGTIGRYVLDLESRGLIAIDRSLEHNTVELTNLGATAVSECLTAECELQHPDQTELEHSLTATTHDSSSTVSPPRESSGGDPTKVESWLAATGDIDEAYVQEIDTHDRLSIHQRFTLPAVTGAVTLVDDPVKPFKDGRVSYLSHRDEECLAIVQWGGPLATLGRLAGVLLSEEALSEILTTARLGETFGKIHDGTGRLTESPGRILRRGQQVGWFSEHEAVYEAWRARIEHVRDAHLARLGRLVESTDSAARGELFEDLHGLIATATQLYHAAGVDLTVTVRLPDTESLATDARKRADLCNFIRYTVPKQSVYGVHAGYRMLFEERPSKLKRRLPYDVEPGASMELTASWVLAGPTATALQSEITDALTAEFTDLREAIATGDEPAPTLTVPVRDGTTYAAIREIVDKLAAEHASGWTSRVCRELTRFCLRSFGRDVPHRASPYDAVTCLLRALDDPCQEWEPAVLRAATTLPSSRFQPSLPPTATKLYSALLRASEPLGRQALIERAGISASSYDRRIGAVSDLPRVRPTTVDGHRKWYAIIQAASREYSTSSGTCRRATDSPLSVGRHNLASTATVDWPGMRSRGFNTQLATAQTTLTSSTAAQQRREKRWMSPATWQPTVRHSRVHRESKRVLAVCSPMRPETTCRRSACSIPQTKTTLNDWSSARLTANHTATDYTNQ